MEKANFISFTGAGTEKVQPKVYMRLVRIIIIYTLIGFFSLPVSAQNAAESNSGAPQRSCKLTDLVGHVYKMVSFKETPPRGESMMLPQFPYQYIAFKENSIYASLGMDMEAQSPDQLEALLKPMENGSMIYTLDKDGILELIRNDMVAYNYRCVAVVRDEDGYIKGDLIMTGYTRKAKSLLFKLYRRWY